MTREFDANEFIRRYFELAAESGTDAYFALFSADAEVEDEGAEHHGIAAIRAWRANTPLVDYAIHSIHVTDAAADVGLDIIGDFPGSPIRLTFRFEFDAKRRIRRLQIRP